MKKFLKWVFAILIILIVISYFVDSGVNSNSTASSSSSTATEQPKQERIEDSYPDQEKSFIQVVEQAINSSKSSANEMQKGGVKADRTDALCSLLKNKSVKNWVGKVYTVDSNSDGKGVLTIQLTRDISVKTWNNALSDISDNTLLTPRTPIFNAASNLKKGDYVTFSGRFISDTESCIRESSLGLSGGLEEPEFIFKFSDIAAR